MKRAEFLKSLKIQRNPDSPGPLGSLDPYTGPWTRKEAIHLLRRATFGVKPSDVNAIVALG